MIPGLHVHLEIDAGCLRVVEDQFPGAICLGDVKKVTELDFRKLARESPGISHVLHVTSPPCQQVS